MDQLFGIEICSNPTPSKCPENRGSTCFSSRAQRSLKPPRSKTDWQRPPLLRRTEFMEEFLDITPGSVSVLGLMNDKRKPRPPADRQGCAGKPVLGCHPCINTSSLRFQTRIFWRKFFPQSITCGQRRPPQRLTLHYLPVKPQYPLLAHPRAKASSCSSQNTPIVRAQGPSAPAVKTPQPPGLPSGPAPYILMLLPARTTPEKTPSFPSSFYPLKSPFVTSLSHLFLPSKYGEIFSYTISWYYSLSSSTSLSDIKLYQSLPHQSAP